MGCLRVRKIEGVSKFPLTKVSPPKLSPDKSPHTPVGNTPTPLWCMVPTHTFWMVTQPHLRCTLLLQAVRYYQQQALDPQS